MSYDLTQPGTPIDVEKMRSLQVLGQRTKPIVHEGREHPESGRPFKAVTDDLGNTVTEHGGRPGTSGVSERQDVNVCPQVVTGLGAAGLE